MPTPLKSLTARLNGAKSRGPKTPESRARVALNATRHGLASTHVVVKVEDEAEFRDFRNEIIREIDPRSMIEHQLVDQLVAARWHLRRTWGIEAALLDREMERQVPHNGRRECNSLGEPGRLALAFRTLCDDSRVLEILYRYQARHERSWHRALESLASLRENLPNEPTGDENKGAGPVPAPTPAGSSEPLS